MQKFVKDFSEVQNLTEEKESFSFLKLRLINTHVRVLLTNEENNLLLYFTLHFILLQRKVQKLECIEHIHLV